MADIFGLVFELIFLAMGIGLYLFATGRLNPSDPKSLAWAKDFRQKNGWWLRVGALALTAIMLVNLYLHLQVYISAQG
mgnify:CR=1 FL=1